MSLRLSSFLVACCFSFLISVPVMAASSDVSSALDDAKNLSFNFGSESSLKIASPTQPCDTNTEGAIRYNKTSKKVELCDGSSWAPVWSSGPTRIWTNFAPPARALYTDYVNNTDHNIDVSVQVYSGPGGTKCAAAILINGVAASLTGHAVAYQFTNASTSMCNARATIPPGTKYYAGNDGGAGILYQWDELR